MATMSFSILVDDRMPF